MEALDLTEAGRPSHDTWKGTIQARHKSEVEDPATVAALAGAGVPAS